MTYPCFNHSKSFVSGAIIGLTLTIPMSNSLSCIFWVASLLLILLTPYYKKTIFSIINTPLGWSSVSLFLVALLSCFWGEASFSQKLGMLSKYLKFLFFPLLIAGFSTPKLRTKVIHVFLGVMLLTTLLSALKWSGVLSWRSADPGEVFYNHIMTGLMMSYAAYMAAWLIYTNRSYQILYGLLFLLFTFQLFFINPSRTGYILYLLLMILFLLQIFPLKKALATLCISGLLFGVVIYQSPTLKAGIHHLSVDLTRYKNNTLNTSLGFRIQFQDYAKDLFFRHWILGNGVGGFEHAYRAENPVSTWKKELKEPHSEYWLILSEFGLFGFSVYFLFLITLLREIMQLTHTRIPALGIFTIFFVGNFSDSLFYYATTQLFFMTMMAMCLGEKYEN